MDALHTKPPTSQNTTGQSLTLTGPAAAMPLVEGEPLKSFALTIVCRGEAEAVVVTPHRPIVVGRRVPADVIVEDPAVSRQHARFAVREDRVVLEDLDSRNGTFIAGKRVDRAILSPGDSVQIGPATITLVAPARAVRPSAALQDLVIVNETMKRLYETAGRLADRDIPVLITGETGTGKEHVARALHSEGARRKGPFIAVNCAAIPSNLVESTFFGHERGAFTGASVRAIGVFEQAAGGVLFLDEVGEMPTPMQAALLRSLETSAITRVGASAEIQVDVRVVAATHRRIEPGAAGTTFRPDLYYRLSSVVIDIPPLRERRDEIEPLALRFLEEARSTWGISCAVFEPEAMDALRSYDWPGNVRELRHVVQRAALLGREDRIRRADLGKLEGAARPPAAEPSGDAGLEPLGDGRARRERELIERALQQTGGNRRAAAALLQVPHRTFYRKLRQHGL